MTLVANLYRVLRKFYVLRLDRHVSIASCRLETATQKETLPVYTQVVAYSTDRIMSCLAGSCLCAVAAVGNDWCVAPEALPDCSLAPVN